MPKSKLPRLISIEVLALALIVLVVSYFGYTIFQQTQAYSGLIPEFSGKHSSIVGIATYTNINKEKYSDIDTIEAAEGELLVRLNDYTPTYEIAKIAEQYNMEILTKYRDSKPSYRLRFSYLNPNPSIPTTNPNQLPTKTEPLTIQQLDTNQITNTYTLEDIWRELDSDPRVYCVGLNAVVELQENTPWGGPGYWPDDPEDAQMERIFKPINAPVAWQELYDNGLPYGGDGENVWIAIIDTGVDLDHPDLEDNIARDANGDIAGTSVVECSTDIYNYDCEWIGKGGESGGNNIDDNGVDGVDEKEGHGTKVAGAAAEFGNNGLVSAGVAFTTQIVSVKAGNVNNDYPPTVGEIITGIDFAASLDKVRVINISSGVYVYPQDERDAIQRAWDEGIVVVSAAGNNNTSKKLYPAAFEYDEHEVDVIAVGGLAESGAKDEHSNYGDWVDVSAPYQIYTTNYDNGYTLVGGTSISAPIVSGSIALLLSRYPNLTPEQVIDIVIGRADTYAEERGQKTIGCGRVNVGEMLLSKAPIIKSPDCKGRFWLGKDIKLEWEASPFGSAPDSYSIQWKYKYGTFSGYSFPPIDPLDVTDIGSDTWHTVYHRDAEVMADGTYIWRIGAWYTSENKMYWSQPQVLFKHTGAQLEAPIEMAYLDEDDPVNTVFIWEPIANALNYVAYIYCYHMPPNPDFPNRPGYYISLKDHYYTYPKDPHVYAKLTQDDYDVLQYYAQQSSYGETTCTWAVAGTQIANPALWPHLELSKTAEFRVRAEE